MYCKNCGQQIDEKTAYCPYCGTNTADYVPAQMNDAPNTGFALLGFIIPIIGLILYLVHETKQPKKAKSAGKGALIGFIIQILLCIICIIGFCSYINNISDSSESSYVSSIFDEESVDEILDKYVNVSFGEFDVTSGEYYDETSLDVTVKNISDQQYSFSITIEAVDKNGARLGTDTVYVDRLNSGQSITLTAFEYIDDEKVDELKNASFKVLDIDYYNY